MHGAERPSTFLITDRNLRSLPSPACAPAWSRRGWPSEVLHPSSGTAARFCRDNKSFWRSAQPRLRRFRLAPGLQGWASCRGSSPNHCPDVVVASNQPWLMSSSRVHTLLDFCLQVSSVSPASLVLCWLISTAVVDQVFAVLFYFLATFNINFYIIFTWQISQVIFHIYFVILKLYCGICLLYSLLNNVEYNILCRFLLRLYSHVVVM